MKLTRKYFEQHGYTYKPILIEGQEMWSVKLHKRFENGDHVYANVEITNLMYEERFAFSGNIGNHCYFQTVMLYSIEDLENLYKLSHVRYDEKTNDFYCVKDNYKFTPEQASILDKHIDKFLEQKSTNKVEPKFHEGEWIIRSAEGFKHDTYLVKEVKDYYVCEELEGKQVTFTFNDVHKNFKLWDISDAKDGDVLSSYPGVDYPWIGIFHKLDTDRTFSSYCYLEAGQHGKFCPPSIENILGIRNVDNHESKYVVPATKEQRDTLIKTMADAGYTFDFEKKELNKIEQKSDECRQESKPNGGIVCEDFNDGDGHYKVNLAYLNKSQVELIERLVESWQNSADNTAEWSKEDSMHLTNAIIAAEKEWGIESCTSNWLKSLRPSLRKSNKK